MHSNDQTVNICFLEEFPSLKEGIFSLLKISKNQLKKSNLTKNYLNKKIRAHDEVSLPLNLVNRLVINPLYIGEPPSIVFEDEELLGISKPVQIHGHPLDYQESDNILSFMRSRGYSELLEVNGLKYDRGLLYRLDYETSGLLLYSKLQKNYDSVRENFKTHIREKTYLAIVTGNFQTEGKLVHYLKSSGVKNSLIETTTADDGEGTKVECVVKRVDYNNDKNLTLVEVQLFQGYRHQIRKQLQASGYPIFGDPLYSEEKAQRMFLHCWKYTVHFESEKTITDNTFGLFLDFFNLNSKL